MDVGGRNGDGVLDALEVEAEVGSIEAEVGSIEAEVGSIGSEEEDLSASGVTAGQGTNALLVVEVGVVGSGESLELGISSSEEEEEELEENHYTCSQVVNM